MSETSAFAPNALRSRGPNPEPRCGLELAGVSFATCASTFVSIGFASGFDGVVDLGGVVARGVVVELGVGIP